MKCPQKFKISGGIFLLVNQLSILPFILFQNLALHLPSRIYQFLVWMSDIPFKELNDPPDSIKSVIDFP